METKRRLSLTFPHRLVLIISILLGSFSLSTIAVAVFSLYHKVWGYYWGTGFWCGGVVVLAATSGIVSTRSRTLGSVKGFMIFSIFGGLVSLAMLALSAGGLDSKSGFYQNSGPSWPQPGEIMTKIVHGSFLGLSVIQLACCVVADGVCIYFLFIDKGTVLFPIVSPKNKAPHRHRRNGTRSSQTSLDSTLLLYADDPLKQKGQKHKRKKNSDKRRSGDAGTIIHGSAVRRTSPRASRRNSASDAIPSGNACARSASFTTFGRTETVERESLIVHPNSVSPDVSLQPANRSSQDCHYAQTNLYGSPIPIEEDDELPPYEVVDSNPYYNVDVIRPIRASKVDSAPSVPNKLETECPIPNHRNDTSGRNSETGSRLSFQDPDETIEKRLVRRSESGKIHKKTGSSRTINGKTERRSTSEFPQMVQSRSLDLLSSEFPVEYASVSRKRVSNEALDVHQQGVSYREFARSTDKIMNPEKSSRVPRSQSVRIQRERRLDRRKRALSAEIKLNKDQILSHGQFEPEMRTRSIDFSQGAFADMRFKPTKFSLRTPVGQSGSKNARRTAVPVRAVTLPRRHGPPKPPRTHSYTKEDFSATEHCDTNGDECVFIDDMEEVKTVPPVEEAKIDKSLELVKQIESLLTESSSQAENVKPKAMKVDAGPVLKCVSTPSKPTSPQVLPKDKHVYDVPWDFLNSKSCKDETPSKRRKCADNGKSKESVIIRDINTEPVNIAGKHSVTLSSEPSVSLPDTVTVSTARETVELEVDQKFTSNNTEGAFCEIDDTNTGNGDVATEEENSDSHVGNRNVESKFIETTQNLRMKLPHAQSSTSSISASPSERILQRSASLTKQSSIHDSGTSSDHVELKMEPSSNNLSQRLNIPRLNSSREFNGARPKVFSSRSTLPSRSRAPSLTPVTLSSSYKPIATDSASKSSPLSSRISSGRSSQVPVARGPLANARQTRVSSTNVRTLSESTRAQGGDPGAPSSSVRSQGIHHLPQSQFPRQVSSDLARLDSTQEPQAIAGQDHHQPIAHIQQPVANNVLQQQANNNGDRPKPLFAMLL